MAEMSYYGGKSTGGSEGCTEWRRHGDQEDAHEKNEDVEEKRSD